MNETSGKYGVLGGTGKDAAIPPSGKKAYEAPRLTVHGSVEAITQARGLLLTDSLLTGSTVTTVSVLG